MGRGRLNQRHQATIAVGQPAVIIVFHQRRFVRQAGGVIKRGEGAIGFGQSQLNGGQLLIETGGVATFHLFHILHNPHAQGTAVVNGIDNG